MNKVYADHFELNFEKAKQYKLSRSALSSILDDKISEDSNDSEYGDDEYSEISSRSSMSFNKCVASCKFLDKLEPMSETHSHSKFYEQIKDPILEEECSDDDSIPSMVKSETKIRFKDRK